MIYISEKAKERVVQLMAEKQFSPVDYFLRVSVQSGGCSGLSYKMDFDKDLKVFYISLILLLNSATD